MGTGRYTLTYQRDYHIRAHAHGSLPAPGRWSDWCVTPSKGSRAATGTPASARVRWCVAGRTSFASTNGSAAWQAARELIEHLTRFGTAVRPDELTSFVAVFGEPAAMSESRFSSLLWEQLQQMHDLDSARARLGPQRQRGPR